MIVVHAGTGSTGPAAGPRFPQDREGHVRERFDALVALLQPAGVVTLGRGPPGPTLLTLRTLARRVAYDELDNLAVVLRPLVQRTAPGLLGMHGVCYDVAAKLLVAAGDNPQRLRSEATFAHLCGVSAGGVLGQDPPPPTQPRG